MTLTQQIEFHLYDTSLAAGKHSPTIRQKWDDKKSLSRLGRQEKRYPWNEFSYLIARWL